MQSRNQNASAQYITDTFVQEPAWMQSIRAQGESLLPGIQLAPEEGHLLRWLVRISGATAILEIGSFMGYSTLWMASGLPEPGRIVTLERDANHAAYVRRHSAASPYAAHIQAEEGDALAWLAAAPRQPTYDFVFIDAEKRSYMKYLDAVLPLLKPGAWIVGDNSLLFGALAGVPEIATSPEAIAAMRQFNATLADSARFETVLLPTREGMTIARLKASR